MSERLYRVVVLKTGRVLATGLARNDARNQAVNLTSDMGQRVTYSVDRPPLATTEPMIRCEKCLGLGYRGRYVKAHNGMRHWKVLTCRGCAGSGQRDASVHQRNRSQL